MKIKKIKIPEIPEEEQTPVVKLLLSIIYQQQEIIEIQNEEIQALKDEIAILKGQKSRPEIKPSTLEKDPKNDKDKEDKSGKRPGSDKKNKNAELEIHETKVISPENVPKGSRFKGYKDFIVQDIIIKPHNTRFRLECWVTPDGDYVSANLPDELSEGHFGSTLISTILYQYYQLHTTQPLILEMLHEWGIQISSGQLNVILTEGKTSFHNEKDSILEVGLDVDVSDYVQVDDTGARHKGQNGYATHIGNDLFAWFESTNSKSRINFLELLRHGHQDYKIDEDALEYMAVQRLPPFQIKKLKSYLNKIFTDKKQWEDFLTKTGITSDRHVRIVTEGALLASVLSHGFNPDLVILSDDAGQFNLFLHALCWIHAERTIKKITPFNQDQRQALEKVRSEIWAYYQELKSYKQKPSKREKANLMKRFDKIFTQKTCFITLNLALKRIYENKDELLIVLDRPEIPLHNNGSERDIREYVKKRKISGSTRSDLGRQCRDTFMSLKKTCRKLGVSFWNYLIDRTSCQNSIPQLSELIRLKAALLPV